MILHELRTSAITIGLMNIADPPNVTCRGVEVHHLRSSHIYWNNCLNNFEEVPPDNTLLRMYEKRVKTCIAFKAMSEMYGMQLVIEKQDHSYPKLFETVKRSLDIQQKNENDRQASGENAGWIMAAYETGMAKYKHGGCKIKCFIGRCNRDNCPYKHHNCLSAHLRSDRGKEKVEKEKARKVKARAEREKATARKEKEKAKMRKAKARNEKVKRLKEKERTKRFEHATLVGRLGTFQRIAGSTQTRRMSRARHPTTSNNNSNHARSPSQRWDALPRETSIVLSATG